MGLIDLILCPGAIILAVISVIFKNKEHNIFGVLSYLCCSLPAVFSMYDVIHRAKNNDIAGILDIYPTMITVLLVVIGIVTVLNLFAVLKKQ